MTKKEKEDLLNETLNAYAKLTHLCIKLGDAYNVNSNFYESVRSQYDYKKTLSPKQLGAILNILLEEIRIVVKS